MSEKELRILYGIFGECWQHLKNHSNPDDTEAFWVKLRDDGSAIGKKYDDPIEHQLAVDLVVAANAVIQRYYRKSRKS